MKSKTSATSFVLFLIIFSISINSFASEGSFDVPTSNVCYKYLARLIGLGYVEPEIVGQRPYSMKRFEDAVTFAKEKRLKEDAETVNNDSDFKKFNKLFKKRKSVDHLIAGIENECLVKTGGYWINTLHKMELDVHYAKSPVLTFPQNNGVGNLKANTIPLLAYSGGEGETDGLDISATLEGRGQIGNNFYFLAEPRLLATKQRTTGDSYAAVHFINGYGTLTFGDFAVELGRSEYVWGPAEHGGMMFTGNARNLDGIKMFNPKPAKLPWIFKYLGKWQLTGFGANLGPEYVFKYAWVAGYSLSWMPIKWLEFGFNHAVIMGGEGAKSLTALDIVGEFFGFRPAGTSPGSPNKTSHQMEATALIRFPWRGVELYGVLNNEDKRDTIKRFFRDGSGWLIGTHFPALTDTMSLRVEYTRTCSLQYRSSIKQDGYVLNEKILGSDLGPDGHSVHILFSQDFPNRFGYDLDLDWDYRRSDKHKSTYDADGTLGDIIVVEHNPIDQRFRAKGKVWMKPRNNLTLSLIAGFEHALNCQYISGKTCNNFLIGTNLKLDFDEKFVIGRH